MKYEMDQLLKDVYQQEVKPESILNQKTLRRMQMEEQNDMKKFWNYKKIAVAAVLSCLVVSQGVGAAYAAVNHTSILSLFSGETKEIREQAEKLRETKVQQTKVQQVRNDARQSAYAVFFVREALCDKNQVYVEAAVKPASDKYLLVPSECWSERNTYYASELSIAGEDTGKETIAQYAKRMNKTCVEVGMWIRADDVASQSIDYQTEADGTLVYHVSFENNAKTQKLSYTCDTVVYVPGQEEQELKDFIAFSLKDQTGKAETLCYAPEKVQTIKGTKLVLDRIDFEKSALNMNCTVKYHTTDPKAQTWEKWIKTDDSDVKFYLLDEDGNEIASESGYGDDSMGKDGALTEHDQYRTAELPDTLTFLVRNCMTKEVLGTVTVKRK